MPPLSPERWRVVSPYLDQALEIATGERASFLATIRTQDPALAADLQALLADHHALHESRFLERAVPLPTHAAFSASLAGQTLGSYRLVSPVNSAHQEAPPRRRTGTRRGVLDRCLSPS